MPMVFLRCLTASGASREGAKCPDHQSEECPEGRRSLDAYKRSNRFAGRTSQHPDLRVPFDLDCLGAHEQDVTSHDPRLVNIHGNEC